MPTTSHRASLDHMLAAWNERDPDKVLMPGFDVTELNDDGKVVRVLGFFGPLPPADA